MTKNGTEENFYIIIIFFVLSKGRKQNTRDPRLPQPDFGFKHNHFGFFFFVEHSELAYETHSYCARVHQGREHYVYQCVVLKEAIKNIFSFSCAWRLLSRASIGFESSGRIFIYVRYICGIFIFGGFLSIRLWDHHVIYGLIGRGNMCMRIVLWVVKKFYGIPLHHIRSLYTVWIHEQ